MAEPTSKTARIRSYAPCCPLARLEPPDADKRRKITMRIRSGLAPVALLMLALGGCSPTISVPDATPSTPAETPAPTITATTIAQGGSISGKLSYPSEFIPPLAIYAISVADASVNFHVETARDQQNYTITGLAPGTYHVVAYPLETTDPNVAAGYTQHAITQDSPNATCLDPEVHRLLPVTLGPGASVDGIGPNDWCAPAGTFPPRPR